MRTSHIAVRSWLFVIAIASMPGSPAVAGPNEGPHLARPLRPESPPARRHEQEQDKFKLKKAMDAGTVWNSLWWGYLECPAPGAGVPTPGLVTRVFSYAPGSSEPVAGPTYEYDRHGNLVLQRQDYTVGGVPHWQEGRCAYEQRADLPQGLLTFQQFTGSQFPPSYIFRATYNELGRRTLETREYDADEDGSPDNLASTHFVYNAVGLLVEQMFEHDVDADGAIDFRYAAYATYDSRHRITSIVNGYFDGPGGSFLPFESYFVTIDDAAGTAASVETRDYDGDGASDSTKRWTVWMNAAGDPTRLVYEIDDEGRGGPDGVADYVFTESREYDSSGNLLHLAWHVIGTRTLEFTEDFFFTYDARGRLSQMFYTTDTFLDGMVFTETQTTTYTRDQQGRVLEQRTIRVLFGGRTDTSLTQYRYDGIGNLIEMTGSSWWNDDPPTLGGRTVWEYTEGRSGQAGSDRN